MGTSTKQDQLPRNEMNGVSPAVQILPAYLEKSPTVQAVIRDLLNIARNESLPPEERRWAEATIQEALFGKPAPAPASPETVMSREEWEQLPRVKEVRRQMDEEEKAFVANLARLLQQRNMSQAELARRVGVGPSAISMMLSRRCRPQKRTVEKIAQAFGVEVSELWPG